MIKTNCYWHKKSARLLQAVERGTDPNGSRTGVLDATQRER